MASFRLKHGGWMAFAALDGAEAFEPAFTIAYRFTYLNGEQDVWTDRLDKFKSGNKKAVQGALSVVTKAVAPLVKGLNLDPNKTVFVPALHSNETEANPDGQLSLIAKACAKAVGAECKVDALSKKPHPKLHSLKGKGARAEALKKAGYKCTKLQASSVIVVDDLATNGDTLAKIAQAVKAANPKCEVYGIFLGKNESKAFGPNKDLTNKHVPAEWDKLWQEGEAK